MRRDVINAPNFEIVEEEGDHNHGESRFHQNTFVMTHDSSSKPHEEDSPVDNHARIYNESCESSRREEKPCLDAVAENHHLEYEVQFESDEESISDCETMLLSRPTVEIEELDESEDTNKNADDEEAGLLNDVSKIILIRTPDFQLQNEKLKLSRDDISSRVEVREKEEKRRPRNKLKKKKKKRKKNTAVVITDVFLSVAVVGPLVVSCWRGLWVMMDLHPEIFPMGGCFYIGVGIHTSLAILKYHLHAEFAMELKAKSAPVRFIYRLVRILYTYIFAWGCIMQWRGGWIIIDDYSAKHKGFLLGGTIAFWVVIILLRSSRNLLAAPYFLVIDKPGYTFHFHSRFKLSTRDWPLYILDCAFSVAVVGTLVVFVWRGVWVLFDLYLFPDNPEYSAVGSIVIGYAIVVITFSLQPLMRYVCTRLKGLPRLAAADVFLLLSFAGTVNVWRGVWNVLGLWLLPEDPELSCWITHFGCFAFLVLLNCSNSVLVRGVDIDADEEGGKCAVFPCHYLRLFFKIEREKKEARRQNLVVASKDLATITERVEKEENGTRQNTSNFAGDNPESPF